MSWLEIVILVLQTQPDRCERRKKGKEMSLEATERSVTREARVVQGEYKTKAKGGVEMSKRKPRVA